MQIKNKMITLISKNVKLAKVKKISGIMHYIILDICWIGSHLLFPSSLSSFRYSFLPSFSPSIAFKPDPFSFSQ